MLSIKKLTLSELAQRFEVLTEEECLELMAGWDCFSHCLNYLGHNGDYFNQYYSALYGDPESSNGVTSTYIGGVMFSMGINNSNHTSVGYFSSGDIIAIGSGTQTHAVIYTSHTVNNGVATISYYDPENNKTGTYSININAYIDGWSIN